MPAGMGLNSYFFNTISGDNILKGKIKKVNSGQIGFRQKTTRSDYDIRQLLGIFKFFGC